MTAQLPRKPAIAPAPARDAAEQPPVGPRGIGVRHHDVGLDALAGGEPHAGRGAAGDGDLGDLSAEPHLAALALDQVHQPVYEAAGAAHREVHAVATLEVRDQAVDRGDVERIAADEQRMETQHEAQPRIAHVARDHRVQ